MYKTLSNQLILMFILITFYSMSQITETGISDDFSSATNHTKRSSLLHENCNSNNYACYEFRYQKDSISDLFSTSTIRNTNTQKLEIDLFQGYANYSTYNFSFGSICTNNLITPLSIDLSNNSILSFGIELLDEYSVDTTSGIYLEIHLEDINGDILNYDKKVIDNLSSNWQYWIGITHSVPNNINIGFNKEKFLPEDGLINFSYDFSQAWSSDKIIGGKPDDSYDFDLTQVVKLGFLFRSANLNSNDSYHSQPIRINIELSDFKFGQYELSNLGTNCEGDIVLGNSTVTSPPLNFNIDYNNRTILLDQKYKYITIYNLNGDPIMKTSSNNKIDINHLNPGVYLLKTELFSKRFFIN